MLIIQLKKSYTISLRKNCTRSKYFSICWHIFYHRSILSLLIWPKVITLRAFTVQQNCLWIEVVLRRGHNSSPKIWLKRIPNQRRFKSRIYTQYRKYFVRYSNTVKGPLTVWNIINNPTILWKIKRFITYCQK